MTDPRRVEAADPGARRRALWIGVPLVALAALALWWFKADLDAALASMRAASLSAGEMLAKLRLYALGLAALGLIAAWAILRAGREVIRTRQFPAPGKKVLVDTPVVSGAAAVLRGRLLIALALAVAAVSFYPLWSALRATVPG